MGRSVSVPYNAALVAYDHWDGGDDWEWDMTVECIKDSIQAAFPSLSDDDGWIGNEDRVILPNGHARFGVSEYCGLISIWAVPNDGSLAEHWCSQARRSFHSAVGSLRHVGTFSSGKAIYERLEQI